MGWIERLFQRGKFVGSARHHGVGEDPDDAWRKIDHTSCIVNWNSMERVISFTSFENEQRERLEYWLSRPPQERIAEVERLRLEYRNHLSGAQQNGCSEGLRGSLLLVERSPR